MSSESNTTIVNEAPKARQAEKQAIYGGSGAPAGGGVRSPVQGFGTTTGSMLGGAGAVVNAMLGMGTNRLLGA